MIPLPRLAAFSAAVAVLIATPGSNFLYILTRGTTQGRHAALWSVVGLGIGVMFHTLFVIVGLAALIRSSALAFQVVKLGGGLYLIVLGVRKFFQPNPDFLDEAPSVDTKPFALIGQSVATSLLNPKTVIFFLTFLPQFVAVEAGRVLGQLLILGVVYMGFTLLIYGSVGFFSGSIGEWLRRKPALSGRFHWVTAVVFIGLGLTALLPTH